MFSVPGKAMNKQAGNHASFARYKRKKREEKANRTEERFIFTVSKRNETEKQDSGIS